MKCKPNLLALNLALATLLVATPKFANAATRVLISGAQCTSLDSATGKASVVDLEFGDMREITGDFGHAVRRGYHIKVYGKLVGELQKLKLYATQPHFDHGDVGLYYNAATKYDDGVVGAKVRNDQRTVFNYYVKFDGVSKVNLKINDAANTKILFERDLDNCKAN